MPQLEDRSAFSCLPHFRLWCMLYSEVESLGLRADAVAMHGAGLASGTFNLNTLIPQVLDRDGRLSKWPAARVHSSFHAHEDYDVGNAYPPGNPRGFWTSDTCWEAQPKCMTEASRSASPSQARQQQVCVCVSCCFCLCVCE